MKRLLSLIFMVTMLLSSLATCGNRITIDEYDVVDAPIARAKHTDLVQYHAGCLYIPTDTVMRYSINADTLTALCIDPLCFHDTADCPFFKVGTNPEIHGTRLFYEKYDLESRGFHWYAYDIDTGICRMILRDDEISSFPTLHRGKLYYFNNILREGEALDSTASYDRALCAVDADTLNASVICILGPADAPTKDNLLGFFGDRILWSFGADWYTTDLDGGDRKIFGRFMDIELRDILFDSKNGALYCLRYTDELLGYTGTADGAFADRRPVYNRIPTIIHSDGSITELPDIRATGFLEVTADYLYYYKFGEITETSIIDGALYRCRHDGSAEECVLTAAELNGAEICRIAGGAAYLRENGALVKLDFETKTRDVIYT